MSQETKWTTTLRAAQEVPPKAKATRMKIARKKKLKEPLPDFDEKTVPIHDVVEDVLKYMKKKEKIVAKINDKKTMKLTEKQDMEEVKGRIMQIEANMAAQFNQVEQNMNMLKGLFDDMKRANEIRDVKWENDLNNIVLKLETKSEAEKAKVVSTLQKIHKEHNSNKKTTAESIKKVEQHAKKTTQSVVNGMQKLSEDLNHTKYDVDIIMKKRFGIVIGGGGEQMNQKQSNNNNNNNNNTNQGLDTSISGFCSVDEGVDLLALRMGQLDHRIAHIEQQDLAARTSPSKPPPRSKSSGLTSRNRRSHRGGDNCDEEGSVDSLEAINNYEELQARVAKTETALAKLSKKMMALQNSDRDSRLDRRTDANQKYHRVSHDRLEEDPEELERVQGQIRSLQRKVKALGDSTSRACRSLSVGVTDAQNASLQLFSWADKVHLAFDHVSKDCLKLSKNILPRVKLMDLTSGSSPSTSAAGKARSKRSASVGSRRGRSREPPSSGGVESDYELDF